MRIIVRPACLMGILLAAPAAAQPVAGGGAYFESYSFGNPTAAGVKSASLLTVPLGADIPLGARARLGVSTAFASGSIERANGTSTSLSGLTNSVLTLSLPVVADRLTLAAALVLPTGHKTYSTEEAEVAGIIAADLLPFRTTNFGSGSAVDFSGQYAAQLGVVNVGARIGYQVGQQFDLLKGGSFSYRPGNQAYARFAADGDVGDSRASAEVTVYTFSDDQLNSHNLYRSGTRVQAIGSFTAPAGQAGTFQTYLGALFRQHGTFADGSANSPQQTVLLLGSGLRTPVSFGILVPQVDVRLLRSGDGMGQGYVAGAGLGMELAAGESATLLPMVRIRTGNLEASRGIQSGITGFDIGIGLRFGANAK